MYWSCRAWFQRDLQGGNSLPPENQIWIWKEIGNLIALAGMVLLLFPVGALLLKHQFLQVHCPGPWPAQTT